MLIFKLKKFRPFDYYDAVKNEEQQPLQQKQDKNVEVKPMPQVQIDGDSYDDVSQTEVIKPAVVNNKNKNNKSIIIDGETQIVREAKSGDPEAFFVDISAPQTLSTPIKTKKETTDKEETVTDTPVENISTPVEEIETTEKNMKEVKQKIIKTKPTELLMPIFLAPRWPHL